MKQKHKYHLSKTHFMLFCYDLNSFIAISAFLVNMSISLKMFVPINYLYP